MRRKGAAAVALIAVGTIVVLAMGNGPKEPVKVPHVVGKPYEEAARLLSESGFRVERVDQTCIKNFELFPEESLVVSRIRRGGTGVQGGVDSAPRGEKLSLDVGIDRSVLCFVPHSDFDPRMLLGVLWVSGALVLSVFAGRDMRRRGENGGVWGTIVFLLFPLGLLLWLVVRADKPLLSGAQAEMRRDAEAFSPFEPSDRG